MTSKETILNLFRDSKPYKDVVEKWYAGEESISVSQLSGSARSFLLAGRFEDQPGQYLVITRTEQEAERVTNDINELLDKRIAYHFPDWGVNPYQWKSPLPETIGSRLETLAQLQKSDRMIVTAGIRALMEPTISPEDLQESSLLIEVNQKISLDDIVAQLIKLGYERYPLVEEVGNFAVRGGIVDIFPHTTEHPVRIELFGDFVESLRYFTVSTQRSISTTDSVKLLPQREILLAGSKLEELLSSIKNEDAAEHIREKFRFGIDYPGLEWASSLFTSKRDYLMDFLPENTTLYLVEPELIESEAEKLIEEFQTRYDETNFERDFYPSPERIYYNPDAIWQRFSKNRAYREIFFAGRDDQPVAFDTGDHPVVNAQMKMLKQKLDEYILERRRVYIACDNKVQRERMEDILGEQAERVILMVADISEGFTFPTENFVLLCESYTNLNVGDYVVHVDYGIGRYKGLKEITVDKRRRDCLLIQYGDGDRLYVPIEEFNRVQKYIGKEGKPQITKLGGPAWEKVKARTKKAIADMAEELIKLYAERKSQSGYAFSQDDSWMTQLEASFPYDETPDQLQAIEQIKKDMEAPHPTDRLICGDVGFGKTEVAIRAAFKCVNDDKQVAVLVPTTILAQQHLSTFSERLKEFPIRVEMLSRFRTRKEQKVIVEELAEGKIDIVIGTHRLLSKDIKFRDLGLLIVDEEQRFGVAHKEKIKKMRRLVDVIAMSATPIPRTMQMSLLGARDMSIINTSPKDRLPIRTEIVEFHPDTITEAILAEIERGGQVYFVHNRVQTIMSIYRYLSKLLPTIKICVGHGQMPEKELEDVMNRFLQKQYDILLSTSIIESGLDIPSVNTIVINRADRFGLAQIYQLRGRVGRSSLKAVAYLVIPPVRVLSATARKRLKAIEQHTELGSGFHLAMRDLEIRGAGNMLGPQQHGFIEEVGFDLYLTLLGEAVSDLKGEEPKPSLDIKIETDVDLFLPNDYIYESQQKVDIYQRLAQADSYETVHDLELELIDRYGSLPTAAENLIRMTEIKILAARAGVEKVVLKKGKLHLSYAAEVLPGKQKVAVLASQVPDPLEFSSGGRFEITVDFSGRDQYVWHEQVKNILQNLAI
jgi:transcription-repair coupling factor (superfamily II helicase)